MFHDAKQNERPVFPNVDPGLWSRLSRAEDREAYARSWLAIQCALIPAAVQGLVALRNESDGSFVPVASWPESGSDPQRLADIVERAIEERCGMILQLDAAPAPGTAGASPYAVAYPVLAEDDLIGVISLEVLAEAEESLKFAMEQLQWGVSWMELLVRRQQVKSDRSALARLEAAVDLLAGVLSEKSFESAAMAFVTELATQLRCDRVSLAFMHKGHARIQAISHSTQIAERMNLVRAIGQAMDEAIVQRREVVYPPPEGEVIIVRDHEQLSRLADSGSILTLPVYGEENFFGAMTMERASDLPFIDEEIRFCRSVVSLLFPVFDFRQKESRPLALKMIDAAKVQLTRLFGPQYLGRKTAVCLVLLAAVFFSLKTGEYKISADAVLEGAVKRVVVAPFDGYIHDAAVRAGDLVDPQMLMCRLDDRELRLQRLNWLGKRNQYQRQYQEALAGHQRAESSIIKAQLDQASARVDLVESMLERTLITAPFRGIVISGDLSQRLGGSVNKGEVLFEVAPLDAYRIILEVDERRIADVRVGQQGRMVLSALPQEPYDFVVKKITPIATAREGMNYFRIEATPKVVSERLRPGMEGVGKISVDRRKLISIWTRDLREWVRLWVWSWWP